jgi:hypothetical protein
MRGQVEAFERCLVWHGEITHWLHATFVGFWLGVLDDAALDRLTERYYSGQEIYTSERVNTQGLRSWEEAIIDRHFTDRKHVLLLGAGGGRETIALARRGLAVDAFECNRKLVEHANRCLGHLGLSTKQRWVAPNECPITGKIYDAAIIGWCAYMHIARRSRRLHFLSDIRRQLTPTAPLVLSFRMRPSDDVYWRRVWRIASVGRRALRRSPPDLGDDLVRAFVHMFSLDEIVDEVRSAGYIVVECGATATSYVVALPQPDITSAETSSIDTIR